MDQENCPIMSAELLAALSDECLVEVRGLKKNGHVEAGQVLTLKAKGYVEDMQNGIQHAIIMIEDENPLFEIEPVANENICKKDEVFKFLFKDTYAQPVAV